MSAQHTPGKTISQRRFLLRRRPHIFLSAGQWHVLANGFADQDILSAARAFANGLNWLHDAKAAEADRAALAKATGSAS
jgi:hypothetical protein